MSSKTHRWWIAVLILTAVAGVVAGCGATTGRQRTVGANDVKATARFTDAARPKEQRCRVTKANFRTRKVPTGLRRVLRGDLRGLYGQGPLWVVLPTVSMNSSRDQAGSLRTKVAWWIDVPGALELTARRIASSVEMRGHGDIAAPTAVAHRIEPTNVVVPAAGCWQVTGRVGPYVSTWVFAPRL